MGFSTYRYETHVSGLLKRHGSDNDDRSADFPSFALVTYSSDTDRWFLNLYMKLLFSVRGSLFLVKNAIDFRHCV